MLSKVQAKAGELLHLKGYAIDLGHRITAVEFSLDNGENWTRYKTEGTNDYQRLTWHFDFTPSQAGEYALLVRSVNDEGRCSPEPDCVEISVL